MNLKKLYYTIRLLLCKDGYARATYIKKHDLFGCMGENCYFHPYWMPSDPKMIYIHNNVKVASGVTFINHDIANAMLNVKNGTKDFRYFVQPIEIFDNVMIGANVTILPGKKIGPNCVVGAGTVVSRNVDENTVVDGDPVRVLGNMNDFEEKRKKYSVSLEGLSGNSR